MPCRKLKIFISSIILAIFGCSQAEFATPGGSSESPYQGDIGQPGENILTQQGDDQTVTGGQAQSECVFMTGDGKRAGVTRFATGVRQDVFHKAVAVDPGGTGLHYETNHGHNPSPLSQPSTLSSTSFRWPEKVLRLLKPGDAIEILGFAHQFKEGLDTCALTVRVGEKVFKTTNPTNPFSAYCYVTLTNIHQDSSNRLVADLVMRSESYSEQHTDPFGRAISSIGSDQPQAKDATNILQDMITRDTLPDIAHKAILLEDLEIKIELGASLYDSVQYRAVRAHQWSPAAPPLCVNDL